MAIVGPASFVKVPFAPVRRADVDASARADIDPTAVNAAAGEDQGVRAIPVEHGKLEIPIERCVLDRTPFHNSYRKCAQFRSALISLRRRYELEEREANGLAPALGCPAPMPRGAHYRLRSLKMIRSPSTAPLMQVK